MSWRAVWQRHGPARRLDNAPLPAGFARGTLMMELDLAEFGASRDSGRQDLIRLSPKRGPERMFSLESGSDGRLHLQRRRGPALSHLSIGLGREPVSGCLRLSYHWDCRRGRSLLTAENLTRGTIRQQEGPHALPLGLDEARALLFAQDALRHASVKWIGLADHWQTVGPVPGLAADARIDTPDGPRPISALQSGDLVQTADHGPLPVLWQGRVALPGMGRLRRIRLIAPYFGLNRDLVVGADQRLALSGADIEYHFGEESVIVEARHLINGQTAVWEAAGAVSAGHALLFDRHVLISANGVWTESLYLGRLSQNADLARCTAPAALGGLAALPCHSAPVRRELLEFEALALNLARLRSRAPLAA